jgi:hypothetical protein
MSTHDSFHDDDDTELDALLASADAEVLVMLRGHLNLQAPPATRSSHGGLMPRNNGLPGSPDAGLVGISGGGSLGAGDGFARHTWLVEDDDDRPGKDGEDGGGAPPVIG